MDSEDKYILELLHRIRDELAPRIGLGFDELVMDIEEAIERLEKEHE